MNAPCKGCPDRDYPRCHMVCEKYKTYRSERAAIREAKIEKATLNAIRSVAFDKYERERVMKQKRGR